MLIYTTGNDGQVRTFDSMEKANEFTWQEYKKTHPDAPEQAHVDNNWDVFSRGFSDTVKNPLGQTASQIGQWSGASPATQKELYKAGNNPLGFVARELGAAAGASDGVQSALETAGGILESAIPAWGQARFYGNIIGNAAQGQPPSPEETQNMAQDTRAVTALTPGPASGGALASAADANPNAVKTPGAKQPEAPAKTPAGAPEPFSAPVALTPANVAQTLPGLTPDGYQNALQHLQRGEKLPAIVDRNSADNATRYFNSGARPGLLGGQPTMDDATPSTSANRDTLDRRVSQSPYSGDAGSYPDTVGIVNEALKRGNVGLSDGSLTNIQKNMDRVDDGDLTHAQASSRESRAFARDAMNRELPVRDRFAALAGAFINATAGPAYLAEKDVSEYLKNGTGARTETKAVMDGMMTHDPLYNR